MAYEILITKRFSKKFQKLLFYIENEWGKSVADQIELELYEKLDILQKHQFVGSLQGREKVRSVIFAKHNRLYYHITKEKIVIINLVDMRINPKRNPYNKK
jgi:plasmid stabilization system protein ParE